jgi:hypothetical protein
LAYFTVSCHSASIGRGFESGESPFEVDVELHVNFPARDDDPRNTRVQEVALLAALRDLPRARHLVAEHVEALRTRCLAHRGDGFEPPFGLDAPLT